LLFDGELFVIDFDNLSSFLHALWVAPLLHLSVAHALGNLTALTAICLIALSASWMHRNVDANADADSNGGTSDNGLKLLKQFLVGLLFAWPLCGWRALAAHNPAPVVGLSGLVHAAAALLATLLLMSSLPSLLRHAVNCYAKKSVANKLPANKPLANKPPLFRLLALQAFSGLCLLGGLVAKLLFEKAWLEPVVWSADWGFAVVQSAHLDGAGVGLVVGLVMALRGSRLN
jgi:membrane associated rhomboid family serine protease